MSGAYIFDVEGTLIDCVAANLKCWDETLRSFGVSAPSKQLRLLSGMDGNEMVATLAPGLDKQARKKILSAQGEPQVFGIDTHERLAALDGLPGINQAFQHLPGDSESEVALHAGCDDPSERAL